MWRRTVAHPGILFGKGQPPDVRPTAPSVYFRTVEMDVKHQRKILASLLWAAWSLRSHSGCATGTVRIKRFVNVVLHCMVSNLKKINNMSTLPPLENLLRTPMKSKPAVNIFLLHF